jgi:hypothetical protein
MERLASSFTPQSPRHCGRQFHRQTGITQLNRRDLSLLNPEAHQLEHVALFKTEITLVG